jgi:N-methylhydantoinase B
MAEKLDPITYEILRNRLWKINEEMCAIFANTTPSQHAIEANDFNAAIMTPEGDALVIGAYVNVHASVIQGTVKTVLKDLSDNPGIRPGDMFLANDAYTCTVHGCDAIVAAPIFNNGELVCWVGMITHELDVGGPALGSFSIDAKSMHDEAFYFPPIKIVEGGVLRKDLLNLWKYNSRMPYLLDGNIRARIAGINAAQKRIDEAIDRYGVENLRATFAKMADDTEARLRARLRELPDGTWRNIGYLEMVQQTHAFKVAVTKKGDRLIFDFTGTAPQTESPNNMTIGGTRGCVEAAVLPLLCWDIPWTVAGMWRCVEIVTEPGTLVDAVRPAATSAAILTAFEVPNMLAVPIGQMLTCSEKYRDRAVAAYSGSGHGVHWEGPSASGAMEVHPLGFIVEGGGTGAWACRDGVDSGGYIVASSACIPNIEPLEQHCPVVHLFWQELRDGAGAGKYRGGLGTGTAFFPYGVEGTRDTGFMGVASLPMGMGTSGGYPAGAHRDLIIRDFRALDMLREGKTFSGLQDVLDSARERGLKIDVLGQSYDGHMTRHDLKIVLGGGGCGYGDPIDRDPLAVLKDVAEGLVSPEHANEMYGVVIDPTPMQLDLQATEQRRQAIRAERLG